MICVITLQLYMLWNFTLFHVRRYREKYNKPKTERPTRVHPKKKKLANGKVNLF